MKWFKAMLTILFLGVFALATNHCRLEVLKGLEFLVCCSHETEHGETAPHQDDDCETDGCASLEEGLYKSEDGHVASLMPMLFVVSDSVTEESARGLAQFGSCLVPPELPRSWQFLLRTAPLPRAPSVVS